MKNKILITGGAGFIGSNLCEFYLGKGDEVVCLDNLSTGRMSNIEAFLGHSCFTFLEGDIREIDTCRTAVKACDYVLHQAAIGSVPRSIDDPIRTNDNNVNGFLNILVAARDEGVKRIVYAASSSTYGDSKQMPKVEEVIGNPLSPYAVSKYVNELYAHVFALNYGMELIGLRYFNVFGKNQDPNGAYAAVIPKFINLMKVGIAPTVFGDGKQSRDFTHVSNVVLMNDLAVNSKNDLALNTVFNTACGENASLLELFQIIKSKLSSLDATKKNLNLRFEKERRGDVKHSMASIEKAKKVFGYQPLTFLKEGVEELVEIEISK